MASRSSSQTASPRTSSPSFRGSASFSSSRAARASCFKGKPVNLREVARELGVQFVLEGSVRKAGNRVRVTVQLIDAELDRHVWAERFDRQIEDVFAIQDEVVASIVATLAGRVEAASRDRAKNKPTDNMAAYECVLAGKTLHHRRSPEANKQALQMLERAIQLDPGYAHAHAWKACVLGPGLVQRLGQGPRRHLEEVVAELEIALGSTRTTATSTAFWRP